VDALLNWGHSLLASSRVSGLDQERRKELIRDAQKRYQECAKAKVGNCIALKCIGMPPLSSLPRGPNRP